jgi:hypothetical protein
MHKLITMAALAAIAASSSATDVGVSVQISQPGVYGRIDLGRFPQPAVVVAQPVLIAQPRVVMAQPAQPVYMWVPPGHRKHWSKHCREYGACGVPVYFVRDEWYEQHVVVAANGHSGEQHGKGHGKGQGKHKD